MKKSSVSCAFVIMVASIITIASNHHTRGAERNFLPGLPNLTFETCVQAKRSVMRNPFSKNKNDILLITRYEESPEANHLTRSDDKAINAILVARASINDLRHVLLISSIALVVEQVHIATGPNSKAIYRQWVFMDTDGNGKLDKAHFGEGPRSIVQRSFKPPKEIVPLKLTAGLQRSFEKAVHFLSANAERKPDRICKVI